MPRKSKTKELVRRDYHHGDLAEALVGVALELLNERGVSAISLREVARLAGVSHGAPAHHFGGKSGLLRAVAVEGHSLLAASLTKLRDREEEPADRLRIIGEGYVRFAVAQPALFSVMFDSDEIDRRDPEVRTAMAQTNVILEECVTDLLNSPGNSSTNIAPFVNAAWSQVHGFAKLWLSGNFGDPQDERTLNKTLTEMLGSKSFNRFL